MDGLFGNHLRAGLLATAAIVCVAAATPAMAQTRNFNVPAQAAENGVSAFARQADIQLLISARAAQGKRTNAVQGAMSVDEGLRRLLAGTGLSARLTGPRTWSVVPSGESGAGSAAAEDESADGAGIAEILVVGNPSLNADIRRSEDGVQPYVVFSQDEIRNSNATNIDDFLRTRLPQNAQRQGLNQVEVASGTLLATNTGQVDLRGLGSGQTLVLVDGRRVPGANYFSAQQANINGIPLGAIERIEVLPSSAGAIYGGTAVGGVLNVILRRDYAGVEAQLDYGNTFDGATGDLRATLLGGFRVGPARIMLRAGRARTGELQLQERNDLLLRSRLLLRGNNPAAIAPPLSFSAGSGNICASAAAPGACNGTALIFDNGTPLGASFTYIPTGYSGPTTDGGSALLANAGRYSLDASRSPQTVLRGTRTESAGFNVSVPITNWLEFFGDVSWDRIRGEYETAFVINVLLPADAANNPFRQSIQVGVPVSNVANGGSSELETLRLNGGLIARLPFGWSLSLEQGWNRGENSFLGTSYTATNAARAILAPYALADVGLLPPPDITSLLTRSDTFTGPVQTTTTNTAMRLAGPLFRLPGGRASATLLAERRVDEIANFFQGTLPTTYRLSPERKQTVHSLYAETRLPLIGPGNNIPAIYTLEVQTSGRYDRYTTIGTSDQFTLASPEPPFPDARYNTNRIESFDYLIGLRYMPVEAVILRGSYSTGFLPPAVNQASPQSASTSVINIQTVSDPKRGGEDFIGDANGNILVTGGGNPNLHPERSRSFSAGFILQPFQLRGLRLSADYTDIRKTGEISSLLLQELLNNEDRLPGRIQRGPNRPGDPAGYAGPVIAYDLTLINLARTRVKAWDFQADYSFENRLGRFHVYGIATRQTAAARALFPGETPVSRVDFSDGPLRWRGNVGLDWTLGELRLGWNMQYYDSYRICGSRDTATQCNSRILNQGSSRVPSQSYHDVSARYSFGEGSSFLSGTEIAVGIQNLFNQRPPAIAVTSQSGFYSGYGDPRLRRFTISLRQRFGAH